MDSLSPLTLEELLELAALDAVCALDEYDAPMFKREFHRASPAIQSQIIEFQAELVSDETLLPNEMPPAHLRERVLEAMTSAAETEAVHLAPLATIGRPERAFEPTYRNAKRAVITSWFWRAAVLALTVSLVIVGYFFSQAISEGNQLAILALSDRTSIELKKMIGPTAEDFIGKPGIRTVTLSSTDPEFDGSATLYINDKTNQAFLVALSMTQSQSLQPYTIHGDRDGNSPKLRTFNIRNSVDGIRLDNLPDRALTTAGWSIKDKDGIVVLRSS